MNVQIDLVKEWDTGWALSSHYEIFLVVLVLNGSSSHSWSGQQWGIN